MGFSVHNSIAVLEGHLGKKSAFIRTPKFNLSPNEKLERKHPVKFNLGLLIEIFMMILFGFALTYGLATGHYQFMVFHFMFFTGFIYVVVQSVSPGLSFAKGNVENLSYGKDQSA